MNTGELYDEFTQREELTELSASWSSDFVAGSVAASWLSGLGNDDLTALAQQALQNNFALRSQARLIGQRYAQVDAASGGRLPNLDATLGARRSAANSELFPEEYLYTNTFDASLRLSWNPDLWGELAADARATAWSLEAALAGFQRQRNSQIANLASNWGALVICRQLLRLSDARVQRARELLEAANQSYTLGLEPLLSLRNQEIVIAGERRSRLTQARQCRDLERSISLALGGLPGMRIRTPDELPPLPSTPAAGVPSDLLTNRGDLIEAQANLKSAYEQIASARAARFPSLSLTASGSRTNDEFRPLFSDDINTFSLAANLAIPLYAFGRLEAQEEIQRSAAAQAEIAYLQAIYGAIKEVEDLLDAEVSLKESIRLAEQSLGFARDSAEIAEQQYIAGISDFSSWVSAELTRFNNLATLLGLARERWQTRMQLHLALGGSPLPEDSNQANPEATNHSNDNHS